jgi:hypothetical protein
MTIKKTSLKLKKKKTRAQCKGCHLSVESRTVTATPSTHFTPTHGASRWPSVDLRTCTSMWYWGATACGRDADGPICHLGPLRHTSRNTGVHSRARETPSDNLYDTERKTNEVRRRFIPWLFDAAARYTCTKARHCYQHYTEEHIPLHTRCPWEPEISPTSLRNFYNNSGSRWTEFKVLLRNMKPE